MAEHAARLGDIMVPELKKLNPAVVKTARGKGLMKIGRASCRERV